jgi:hypothetical protein
MTTPSFFLAAFSGTRCSYVACSLNALGQRPNWGEFKVGAPLRGRTELRQSRLASYRDAAKIDTLFRQ